MGEALERLKTALSDRYAIEREVGAGGMATVYVARDLRHHRKVALKVLRPELAAVLGTDRFLSEIRVTANLQHPHLLPLFDSGEAEGQLFYVMPLVEGESLRARLERDRQLSIDDAIRIATAVAGALDHAHRHGVIHRDLKPENILLHEGQPLVADFGIALAVTNAGGTRITQTGLSLGTPAYMSPEQAIGDRAVDARSDQYALAALTYEMLSGDPPHTASTAQALIAKLLTEPPRSVRPARPSVPEHVDGALLKALEKLPADRFATVGEFAQALTGSRAVKSASGILPAPMGEGERRRTLLWVGTIGVASLMAGLMLGPFVSSLRSSPTLVPSLLEITFSDSLTLNNTLTTSGLALTRDGTQLAIDAGRGPAGAGIYVRQLGAIEARLVRGAESGWTPAFSPDGSWIAFTHRDFSIKKVPTVGGAPITLVDTAGARGLSWGDDGEILFTRGRFATALWRVSSEGGSPILVAAPDSVRGHVSYGWPHALPGGKDALITIWKNNAEVLANAELGIVSLSSGEVTELGIIGTSPRYTAPGYLVFAREGGSVFAAPFSLRRLRITGPAVPVLEGVLVKSRGTAEFALSDNGTIVYRNAEARIERALVAVDRRGAKRPLSDVRQAFLDPRVSPDGRQIAITIGPPYDVWTHDLGSKTLTRLTTDRQSFAPEWTVDGGKIAYISGLRGGDIKWQPWDGSGSAETYFGGAVFNFGVSFGPPRSFIALSQVERTFDIWMAPSDSVQSPRPLMQTLAGEYAPRVSPDGRLIAYVTDESGQNEVYVRPLPGPGARIQVSTDGGNEPVWSREGDELFYRGPTHLISATIVRAPQLGVTLRDPLFPDVFTRGLESRHQNYDVFPNGEEFVMVEGAAFSPRLYAIVNWTEVLRRRAETAGRDR